MKVGDLVKHKYSTMHGQGLIVEMPPKSGPFAGDTNRCMIMWQCYGNVTRHSLDLSFVEVISESVLYD